MIWLLRNPTFLKEFTHNCGIFIDDMIDEGDYRVNREETYEVGKMSDKILLKNAKETEKYRHIDINIIGNNFSITIENKVDSDEHDDQCVSYYNYMTDIEGVHNNIDNENKYFVFLAKNEPKRFAFFGGLSCDEELNRNKNLNRDDKMAWENVKVHTIEDFNNSNAQMKFFNYRLIKYTTVKDILEKNLFTDSFESKLVEQYNNIIEEWEHLGKVYRDKCKDISDDDLLTIADNYKDWRNSKLFSEDSKEMRFIEVAYQYYKEEKAKIDGKIWPILNAMISKNTYIKTDYGRGSYANALPLIIDMISDNDKIDFAEKLLKSRKESNELKGDEEEKIESLLKCHERYLTSIEECNKAECIMKVKKKQSENIKEEKDVSETEKEEVNKEAENATNYYNIKKDDLDDLKLDLDSLLEDIFKEFNIKANEKNGLGIKNDKKLSKDIISAQTVDYRAPMGKNNNMSIATIGGFKNNYSVNLCKNILGDKKYKGKYTEYLEKNKEAKIIFKYTFANGSAEGDKIYDPQKSFNLLAFYDLFNECKVNKIKDELFIKRMNFQKIFLEDSFWDFIKKLKGDEKAESAQIIPNDELDNMIEVMLKYFIGYEENGISYGGYDKLKNTYDNLKNKLEKIESEKDYQNIIKRIQGVLPEKIESIKSRYSEGLKKKIRIVNSNIKGDKDKSNKALSFTWTLLVEYDVDVADIKGDTMSKESAKKLAEIFYEKTIEELKLFGYDTYCKKHLFVCDEDIKARIDKIQEFSD